jgi:hypothetical protein
MAIGSDQQLSDFDNNHDFDDKCMLSEEEAKIKFSTQALNNLEKLISSCS